MHPHALRHSPVGQLKPGWFGNHLCCYLPERHLGASGERTQRGSAVRSWFQGKKHTLAGRKSNPCCAGGLRPLLPKPAFAEPKGRAELLFWEDTTQTCQEGACASPALSRIRVCPRSVSKSAPCMVKAKGLVPRLSRSGEESKVWRCRHFHTPLLAASPRDLVSEHTESCRGAFSLLRTEIPESPYGR